MTLVGWDLGTHRCGWCAGAGDTVPAAGAFRLVQRETAGQLGVEFKNLVLALHRRFPAEAWWIESPFLTPHDAFATVYPLCGLTFLLQTLAETLGVRSELIPQDEVKLGWGGRIRHPRGRRPAERTRMNKEAAVRAALGCGIVLPETQAGGRWDAADGAGVWKAALGRERSPHFARWDELASLSRGGML